MKFSLNVLLLSAALCLTINSSLAADEVDLAAAEQEVREAVVAFNRSYEENDLEAYFSWYLDGATMWFNKDFVAIADYKKDWYELIGSGGGVEKNTLSILRVVVGPSGDSAVAAYQLDVETRMPDGTITRDHSQESDSWFKVDGKWRIAHLHYTTQPQK
jgi:ketosteroid isomerase-like protein